MRRNPIAATLKLKAGEWVEVRSKEEILSTLDKHGRLDSMPFMPEMLQYCGRRLRVYKRADKTCDYIVGWTIRRIENTVLLENSRCDGKAHNGCEAGCLMFWKESWLKRSDPATAVVRSSQAPVAVTKLPSNIVTVDDLLKAAQTINAEQETIYSCQATELRNYTSEMRWWDPRQYIRDVRSGNLNCGLAGNLSVGRKIETVLATLVAIRAFVLSFFRERRGIHYPFTAGKLDKTPIELLNLQPGELVQVRSKEEIMATLDKQGKNRGLLFDVEMLSYCGGIYRVLRRVHHIVDDRTGKMLNMKWPCIILEGVFCKSDYHRLCPRAIYSYWRENWLVRVASHEVRVPAQQERAVGQRQAS